MARALVKTTPGSEHGRVLAAVLRDPRLDAPTGAGAVMRLIRAGITPTQAAVAAGQKTHRAREAGIQAAIRGLARPDIEGPRAGAWVAQVRTDTGTGPTWAELGAAMGWTRPVAEQQIRALSASRWLTTTTNQARSLRPGPAFVTSTGTDGHQALQRTVRRGG